jgi:hypothetical protein
MSESGTDTPCLYPYALLYVSLLYSCQFVSFYFIFFAVLGLELRVYTLSHSTSPFLWWTFFKIRSPELFAGLALNCKPPDLFFLSS